MNTNYYNDFVAKLQELFMMDHAELDFGIYRIMNQKRDDIMDFLENRLLKQVGSSLDVDEKEVEKLQKRQKEILQMAGGDISVLPPEIPLRHEYDANEEQLRKMGNPEELRNEVFSHLVTFFSRYYDGGDFLSKRRYKADTYAIPYNGEEVKLHWANSDQYYIKTSEYFRNYTFELPQSHLKVHFVLKDVSTELNNNKSDKGKERRFALYEPEDAEEKVMDVAENGDLNIYFTYELWSKSTKQEELVADAIEKISASLPSDFQELVTALMPLPKKPDRTLLEKHLTDYTAKNSFDYFIHKNLGTFLKRELDFYLKNEVINIDDLDDINIKKRLGVAKAIKNVGIKIIQMLAQLEDFQKKLWLKKKFVVQSDYCITIDRVPQDLYPYIIANEAQRKEWVRLFAIDEIKGDLVVEGYTEPLTMEFLMDNPYLVLDTAFFSAKFKHKLAASMDLIDEHMNGLLINSENFQALQLLKNKYANEAKCVYIDPPYNTGDDDFAYKDSLKESSWLTFMHNRIEETAPYYKTGGTFAASIDINEVDHLTELLDIFIGKDNRKANITVRRASLTGAKVINPGPVNISENVLLYNNGKAKWDPKNAYRERGYDDRYGSFIINPDDHYEKWQFCTVLEAFADYNGIKKSKLRKELGDKYADELLDFVVKNAGSIVQFATLDENSIGSTAVEMKHLSIKNPEKIFHIEREDANDYYILKGKIILFYKDRLKWMGDGLVPVEQISDIWDDVLPNDLHNEGGVELKKGKKPEKLINRIFEASTNEGDLILDYFAGSATSGAVAIKSKRRFINIEANEYFDDIPLRRLKNTLHGDKSGVSSLYQWKGGGCFKYIRLEQYEDTLNNLKLQKQELEFEDDFKDGYMLNYLLNAEAQESLLDMKMFFNPFNNELNVTRNNEQIPTKVDMVDTFNYLIGLNVEKERWFDDDNICIVTGETHCDHLRTVVIWRNQENVDNTKLTGWFEKPELRDLVKDADIIYVNGENTLQSKIHGDENWQVMLTDEEFLNRMFEEE